MCGIAGLLLSDTTSPNAQSRFARLDAMVEALVRNDRTARRRLSGERIAIGECGPAIDGPPESRQLVSNEDGTIWLAFDGECFNERELRDALIGSGHRFATGHAAEAVVHGYEEWGIRGVAERLVGAAAFCLWDARAGRAFLVRDRLGVKPLYFTARAPALAFSTGLRSLARSGLLLPKLDEEALWAQLYCGFTPLSRTLIAGAQRLPAAHILEWSAESGATSVSRYWDFPSEDEDCRLTIADAAGELRDLLDDAVLGQTDDGPAGCWLTGELDSSAVAAFAARHSNRSIRAFSLLLPGIGETALNAARRVAKRIGAEHTTAQFDEAAYIAGFDQTLGSTDEPASDDSAPVAGLLPEFAAADVGIVLAGFGADELFGGRESHRRFVFGEPTLPAGARSERRRSLSNLREALAVRAGIHAPAPALDLTSPHSGIPYSMQPEFLWCLLNPDRRPSLEVFRGSLERIEGDIDAGPPGSLRRAMAIDIQLRLGQGILKTAGAEARSAGIDLRTPFLDHRIVEYAFRLPDRFKVERDQGNLVLREAVRGLLPDDVVDDRSRAPRLPLASWFRGPLRDYIREALLDSHLVDDGMFTRQMLEAILVAHFDMDVDMSRTIGSLVRIDRWWRAVRDEIVAALPPDGAIPAGPRTSEPTVDILIPVYENFNLVRDCVRSIRAFTRMPFRALLLDDRSSDATQEKLRRLVADDSRFELVCNEENLGFLANCNLGFERCSADYIVLLNSDTVVAPGWLERMVACAESDPAIAIVNPLTNESGNTSVRFAPGLNLLTMAKAIAESSPRDYPDLTTAVGMCMLVRRSATQLLGTFDPAYLNAYCEESDLCMRFTEAGLRVVAADDAFIYHKGWASYDELKKNRYYEHNRAIFDARWSVPYDRDWGRYARRDPLQPTRDRLLRFSIGREDADNLDLIDARSSRLSTSATLHAVGDGKRASSAAVLLPRRSPIGGKPEYDSFLQNRAANPLTRFDERRLALPTSATIRSLPSLDRNRLRITFLVTSLHLSGGVIQIVQLAREMLLAGHDVRIVTESPEDAPEKQNLWLQPLVYRNRRHLIENFPESDVVVATFWVTAHRYLRELRERYDFVSAYYIQDYEAWFYPESDWLNRNNVIHSYSRAEHHIVMSRWLANLVDAHGPRCEIVSLGLDLGVFYRRDTQPATHPRVLSVAAIGPEVVRRGFPDTVEAFRRVKEARPEVEIILYGTEREQLPVLPFEVTCAGRIYDQNKVAELMSSVDVVLDASLWQGFGRPGLEAMACGAVPVLTNFGGLNEYAVDGVNSLLVPPGDPAAAATAILDLLGDPARYARMRKEGLATVPRFAHTLEAERHLELYDRWVSEKFPQRGRELSMR